MSPEERTEIKAKILLRIRRTKKDILDLEEATKPIAPENSIGRISRMDAINNKSVNEAALRSAQAKLVRLETSLMKVDEPGFGLCSKCGDPIQVKRLIIMPESTQCMNCAR